MTSDAVEAARVATTADIDHLAALARAFRAELVERRGGRVWAAREARAEPLDDAFAALLTRDDASVVVGTLDSGIVGYGIAEIEILRDATRLGVISELFVEDEARGVAVGEEIAAALMRFCTDANCDAIDAFALPGDRTAKNFFERSGFTARLLVMHHRLHG